MKNKGLYITIISAMWCAFLFTGCSAALGGSALLNSLVAYITGHALVSLLLSNLFVALLGLVAHWIASIKSNSFIADQLKQDFPAIQNELDIWIKKYL